MLNVDEQPGGKHRLVLGFDGGCMTCSDLAERIAKLVDHRLEVLSLREPQVQRWREQTLGRDAPWAPTLIELQGAEVKAWTGPKMGLVLALRLGPVASWRLIRFLGDVRMTQVAHSPRVARAGALSRGQFLKGLGGVTTAMSVLSGTLVLPALANSREESSISRGTPAQRREIERSIRRSRKYRRAARRAGEVFDFRRAEMLVNEGIGVAVLVVPTRNAGTRGAVATFFVDTENDAVLYDDCSVQTRVGSAAKIVHYENDQPFVELTFDKGYVALPNGRRVRYELFEREATQLGQSLAASSAYARRIVSARYCKNGCCRGSFNFCQGITTLQCRLTGAVNPLLGVACSFIRSYSNNKRAGCNAFAITRCYRLHGCGCPKMR